MVEANNQGAGLFESFAEAISILEKLTKIET